MSRLGAAASFLGLTGAAVAASLGLAEGKVLWVAVGASVLVGGLSWLLSPRLPDRATVETEPLTPPLGPYLPYLHASHYLIELMGREGSTGLAVWKERFAAMLSGGKKTEGVVWYVPLPNNEEALIQVEAARFKDPEGDVPGFAVHCLGWLVPSYPLGGDDERWYGKEDLRMLVEEKGAWVELAARAEKQREERNPRIRCL